MVKITLSSVSRDGCEGTELPGSINYRTTLLAIDLFKVFTTSPHLSETSFDSLKSRDKVVIDDARVSNLA